MSKIIILLLFSIGIASYSLGEEHKLSKSENSIIEAKKLIKNEQEIKDQDIKNIYLNIFETDNITKEDLEKNKMFLKESSKEIIINDKVSNDRYNTTKNIKILTTHEKNQRKFLNNMRKTESFMRRKTDKDNFNSFVLTPLQFPYVEPSNLSNW